MLCLKGWDVRTCQTEIANLQIAVGVNEEISWLEVPVVNACGVNVLKTSENLVQEKLNVIIGQRLVGLNNLGEIRLHQFGNYINLIETRSILWAQNSLDTQDVFVVQESLDLQFPVRSQREDPMLEGLDNLFDGHKI